MIGLKDGGVLTSTFNFMREDVFKKNLSDDIEIVKCEHPCEAEDVARKIMEEVMNILASRNRDSGAVETYIPDTETTFD